MITKIYDKETLRLSHTAPEEYMLGEKSVDEIKDECTRIFEKYKDTSIFLARAYMFDKILSEARIFFNKDELFVYGVENCHITGHLRYVSLMAGLEKEYPESFALHSLGYESGAFTGDCDFGHNCPDYQKLFTLGIGGIVKEAETELEKYGSNCREYFFLQSVIISYTALQKLIKRYITLCEPLKDESENSALRYETLVNIYEHPPRNIHEALQLQMFLYSVITVIAENNARTLGLLDNLLFPYYKNDTESGKFSESDIRAILSHCFYRYYTMHFTANTPFTLCGLDEYGKDASNPLSLIILEEYFALDINDPKIQIRYHDDIPQEILRYAVECIAKGRNSIVFLNDDVVISSLIKLGAQACDARNYVPVGCYEPLCAGKEIAATCAGRVILPKAVEYALSCGFDHTIGTQVGKATKPIEEITSFDEFYSAVKEQVEYLSDITVKLCRDFEKLYPAVNSSPFLSALMDGCISRESARDAYDGGAKYNNTSINVFGIATFANELAVIKKAVFEEKRFALHELFDILKADFKGNEKLRLEFLHKYPKYGNRHPLPDGIAKDIVDLCAKTINGKENARRGVFRIGTFSIDWCFTFGKNLLASADGRYKGTAMSKNMCATTATDKSGVTALINSVTAIDYTKVPNGTVLDLMLHPSALSGKDGIESAVSLIKTYMALSGFAIQINVFDPKILQLARKMPEKYSTLQVRRCGWNVYFNELSLEEQNEFIKQAENL